MSKSETKDNGKDKPEVIKVNAKKIDAKLNDASSKKALSAIAEIKPHIAKLLPIYAGASETERAELLAHSPVLAAFIALHDGLKITKAE